jgi:sulfatase maturation enzyme AslB (radical SAM superfamily)
LPFLTRDYHIHFTGGEPLLSFVLLQKIVALAEAESRPLHKKPHYSLTTNGSLVSDRVLGYLSRYHFTVTLSYDGTAQDIQRQRGTGRLVLSRLEALRDETRIRLRVNSVFTPKTVPCLSESVRLLLGLNVPDVDFNFSILRPWNRAALRKLDHQMNRVVDHLFAHFRKTGQVPLETFREAGLKRIFSCAAGRDRLAFTPDGRIWGCHLFSDYFRGKKRAEASRRYGLGTLSEISGSPEAARARLAPRFEQLAMDRMATRRGDCFLCPKVEQCTVCPVNAAFSGSPLGRIPLYVCRIRKIVMEAENRFRRLIRGAARGYPRPREGGPGWPSGPGTYRRARCGRT